MLAGLMPSRAQCRFYFFAPPAWAGGLDGLLSWLRWLSSAFCPALSVLVADPATG